MGGVGDIIDDAFDWVGDAWDDATDWVEEDIFGAPSDDEVAAAQAAADAAALNISMKRPS
mgnify:CR=1 FL=1